VQHAVIDTCSSPRVVLRWSRVPVQVLRAAADAAAIQDVCRLGAQVVGRWVHRVGGRLAPAHPERGCGDHAGAMPRAGPPGRRRSRPH